MGPTKYNMLSILEERTNEYSDRIALGIRTQMGWKEFSYKGLGLLSRKLGNHLINEVQVKKGVITNIYGGNVGFSFLCSNGFGIAKSNPINQKYFCN